MRPQILYPLFRPVATLKGVGPRLAPLFERLAGARVVDLLWHLPVDLVDRSYSPSVADAEPGRIATLTVRILRHEAPRIKRLPRRVIVADDSGELTLVYFNARADWLTKSLPVGEVRVVSGRTETWRVALQMPHPDLVMTVEEAKQARAAEPVYPLTQGLTPRVVQRTVAAALAQVPVLPEWQDPALLAREGWADWSSSLSHIHAPEGGGDLDPLSAWRRRLAYDELLASQLALAIVRRSHRRRPGRALHGDGRLQAKALAAFGHALTASQERALSEIAADLSSGERMLRLLQGDVGSGKTIVALLAMLGAVEAGAQAALLAPTEILARQHHATIAPLAAAAGVTVVLLTGRMKAAERRDALARLADNRAA
ncbi:MAG: DEAD/DEAH box helicase, partial [Alphaproteobacteria bacterium]